MCTYEISNEPVFIYLRITTASSTTTQTSFVDTDDDDDRSLEATSSTPPTTAVPPTSASPRPSFESTPRIPIPTAGSKAGCRADDQVRCSDGSPIYIWLYTNDIYLHGLNLFPNYSQTIQVIGESYFIANNLQRAFILQLRRIVRWYT